MINAYLPKLGVRFKREMRKKKKKTRYDGHSLVTSRWRSASKCANAATADFLQ